MASIKRRSNGRWRARYYDASGRQHSKDFARKVDGERWLAEQSASIVTGQWVDPRAGKVTVATMAEAWLAGNPSWTEATRARNRSILERHVLPRWGRVPVSRVAFEDVQTWVSDLSASGLAGGTVRKVAGVLSSVLALAVKSRRLAVNPAQGVDLPKQRLSQRRYLSVAQVEALADACGDRGDIALVLAYCGLRIGELAALRVRHVDLLRRRFRVEESVTEVNGQLAWSSPKDHQRRSVPFPEFLSEPLAARLADKAAGELLFGSERGGPLRVRNMRRDWFDAATVRAGVPGLTPHELRHTAASMAVSAGASVLALQRMLGHDKPSTTLDVYSDLFDEDLDDVAHRLSEARARARKAKMRPTAESESSPPASAGL
ncbi:MAG TPA: site-specific integrase [Segeticoccus sp.]|uniref:tyrosine-type recombinase/integrase n=1 Tax=Segeticoccus sp. TaxID=2706531 RepID=UPI002D80F95D|nr:site-specific integrase [Segeticoccus sp.]HET8600048.1 site-specific integrase [Segeticoccus sp.]